MKKRILILVCVLALAIGCTVLSAAADTTHTAYCEYCKTSDVTWEPIVFGTHTVPEGETSVHKHYYFDKDYTSTNVKDQIVTKAGVTLCIDLNGKSWSSYGRAFLANYTTKNEDWSTMNVMDSKGGGTITGRSEAWYNDDGTIGGTNNTGGATIWVAEKCTMNIYGGTFQTNVIESDAGLRTGNGGVAAVCSGAVLNVYDGTFNGAAVSKSGGAVHVYAGGRLNAYGGVFKSGSSADGTGACIGVASKTSKVQLSGDPQIAEIKFAYNNGDNLIIDGAFTGKANIAYNTAKVTDLAAGLTVGVLQNSGSIAGGDLYCTNGYGFTADGTSLKLAELSDEDLRSQCPHCKQDVKWEAFTTTAPTTAGTYHYYLDKDYGTSESKQYSIKGGAQVCIDLRGHSYITTGRAFNVSGETGNVLSIMDTVGGGIVEARGGNNNPGGGTVNVSTGATLNLYSGSLKFTHTPASEPKYGGTGRGGVIQASGTVNIYGGKVIGGQVVDTTYESFNTVDGVGGAVYVSGTLNVLGGELSAGAVPESGAGPCVYVAGSSAKVTLGGNAKVEDIYFVSNESSRFTVNNDFAGSACLSYDSQVVLHQGLAVGVCNATDWQGAISCSSTDYPAAMPVEGKLVLSAYPVGTVAATGGVGYDTLQAAVDAAAEGALVEMLKSVTGSITVSKDICLQLNGCSVEGTVTVAEGATLYGMDAATEDYTVSDGKYGKLASVVGNVAGASVDGGVAKDSYLKITESDGVSFHCVTLQIYAMTLQVDATDDKQEPGLYYKSHFKADEKAAPLIGSYGVALSIIGEPAADNLEDECCYTAFTGFESGPYGNLGNASSTLLTGILKEGYTDKVNLQNMELPIYGRAYAKTTDGQYLFGSAVDRSLAQQLEAIDQIVPKLSANQASAVVKLYNKFDGILANFQLPGIAEAVQTNEEGTLKVLVLGNSHGLDATNLLYEVFHTEAPEQKVVIAALYYSGCNMDQHDQFLTNNEKVYTYHKNDGSQEDRTWVVKDSTCLDALQDEQWDIILMQQMNHRTGIDGNYDPSWKVVADYLLNNQDIAPKLGFHMTWTNPDDYALYLEDDAPLNNPSPASWRKTHERYWANAEGKYDQSKQYLDITRCVKTYLVDDTSLVGRPYDLIVPAATAVEYAQDVCGRPQTEIYRDYTHMNDYGRLIVAYTWYATIMELEEITEVNLDAIPAVLKHRNSKFPAADADGVYNVTEDMKEDLIESVNWAIKNPLSLPTE